MSEYTCYYAVKATSEQFVKEKLQEAKIFSIVDADREDYGFSDKYKRNGNIQWVAITAPALWEPVYRARFDDIKNVFGDVVLFFQEENLKDWALDICHKNVVIQKKFYEDHEIFFTESDKQIISDLFQKDFTELKPFLKPGQGSDFLNFVGIPYMELNDQNLVSEYIAKDGKYSFLPEEILGNLEKPALMRQ